MTDESGDNGRTFPRAGARGAATGDSGSIPASEPTDRHAERERKARFRRGWLLIGFVLVTLIIGAVVIATDRLATASGGPLEHCNALVEATQGIVRLQFAGSRACVDELTEPWNTSLARRSVWLYFLFIGAYVTTLVLFCRWVIGPAASRWWRYILQGCVYAAVFAGGADFVGNVGLLALLGGARAGSWPRVVFWCAVLKFAGIGLVMVVGCIRWIGAESRRAAFLNPTGPISEAAGVRPSAVVTVLAYVWPSRVPILTAAVLVSLAFFTGSSRYLSGLLDPVAETSVLPIAMLALLCAWSATLMLSLIVAYGEDRLFLPQGKHPLTRVPGRIWAYGSIVAAPLVYFTIERSHEVSDRSRGAMVLYAAVGIIVACLLLAFTLRGARWLHDYSLKRKKTGLYQQFLRFVNKSTFLRAGFLDSTPSLRPGHGIAAFLALASLLTYVAVGFKTHDVRRPEYASALIHVLLLILVLSWTLGVLAFVLDRTRVPLVVYLAVWIFVMDAASAVFPTDHEYQTFMVESSPPVGTAGSALIAGSESPIVVAASGGGIQAAGWTAQVLAGLADTVPDFDEHLQIVSAVSGGSVGAMHFMTQHADCGPEASGPPPTGRVQAVQHAMESSLHAVGWGLVYQDLPRTFVPFLTDPQVDRGLRMEDAWKRDRRLGEPVDLKAADGRDALMTTWRRGVAEGKCPGAIFNGMVAETGEPMLFTTVALPNALRRFAFDSHYPGLDLKLTTAARLSAAFPYVSPASRAHHDTDPKYVRDLGEGVKQKRYSHVVDGGYFDNFGVATAAEWLHGALQELGEKRPKRVLLIEICESNSCSSNPPGDVPAHGGNEERSWSFQLHAPLSALLAMRTSAQRARNRWHINLLQQRWSPAVCVEAIRFAYPRAPGPMSWHLTEREKGLIRDAWKEETTLAQAKKVADFLRTPPGPDCQRRLSHLSTP